MKELMVCTCMRLLVLAVASTLIVLVFSGQQQHVLAADDAWLQWWAQAKK